MRIVNAYLRKDGRFECRVTIQTSENGRKTKSFYGRTKEEAESKATCALGAENIVYAETEMTVGQLAADFLSVMAANIKESTLANYRMKLEKHIIPSFGGFRCCKLSVSAVHDFIANKLKSGLSARYVCDIIVLFKSIYRYAARTYNIRNVLENVVMPKKSKPEIQVLNKEQQCTLEHYITERDDLTSIGVSLAMYMGMRIGEVCALRWTDVDLEKRIITVNHTIQRVQGSNGKRRTKLVITEPKSASSKREIPIPECLMVLLNKFKNSTEKFVISGSKKPVEPRTLQYRFAKILRNAKLPSVHYHSLRHLFATNCVALGFDVKTLSEILGHSSVELTLNRYVHSSIQRKTAFMSLVKTAA